MVEIEEERLVEKLVAHPAIEAFDEAVLHWLAGCDVVPVDLMILCPAEDRILNGICLDAFKPWSTKFTSMRMFRAKRCLTKISEKEASPL